ncbi:MAG: homocysteine S-methyltransferase family protein [Caldilineaceae bacterium]
MPAPVQASAVPAWLSFACCDDAHVCHGETLAACTWPSRRMRPTWSPWASTARRRAAWSRSCAAWPGPRTSCLTYPNSGEQWDAAAKCWLPYRRIRSPRQRLWYAAGARLIGGCCRTTPADVADMARVLRAGHDVH